MLLCYKQVIPYIMLGYMTGLDIVLNGSERFRAISKTVFRYSPERFRAVLYYIYC